LRLQIYKKTFLISKGKIKEFFSFLNIKQKRLLICMIFYNLHLKFLKKNLQKIFSSILFFQSLLFLFLQTF